MHKGSGKILDLAILSLWRLNMVSFRGLIGIIDFVDSSSVYILSRYSQAL